MIDHISTFKEIFADMEIMEVKYDEEDLRLISLCSLPSLYTTFRDTIFYIHETLTLEEVNEALCLKETMKQLVNGSEAKTKGLIAKGRSQEKGYGNSEIGKSKSKIRNKYCKKKRHIIDDCYKLQNTNKAATNQKGKQPMDFDKVSVVENDHNDGELLLVSDGHSKPSKEWVLDSCCTFHMCSNRDWFSTYENVSKGTVLMGNYSSYKVPDIDTIRIKRFDGIFITLGDVKHIPYLKRNLLSLSTLNSKGYKYTSEGRALKVSKAALVMMKGQKELQTIVSCKIYKFAVPFYPFTTRAPLLTFNALPSLVYLFPFESRVLNKMRFLFKSGTCFISPNVLKIPLDILIITIPTLAIL